MAASFLAYANISVFFQFYPYLQTLPIDPGSYGLLIGAFSATSLILRPWVIPFITTDNGRRYLYIGTVLMIVSLVAYRWAGGFWGMLLVRIVHGLSFVFSGASLMAMLVSRIPPGHSSQVFGVMSIVVMLPNTIVPPIWPLLNSFFDGFDNVLTAFALFTCLMFPMAALTGRSGEEEGTGQPQARLSRADIKEDLADHRIWGLLSAMLFLYCGVALVFFFLVGLAHKNGLAEVGLFFTLTTFCEIAVRVAAGQAFDRMPKAYVITGTMIVLCLGYALLGRVTSQPAFYALAGVLGLSWGVAMPVCNGLMFDWSQPRHRAFNTNLGLQMFQGGFFIGPFVGAFILDHASFARLYDLAAALALAAAAIMAVLGKQDTR